MLYDCLDGTRWCAGLGSRCPFSILGVTFCLRMATVLSVHHWRTVRGLVVPPSLDRPLREFKDGVCLHEHCWCELGLSFNPSPGGAKV